MSLVWTNDIDLETEKRSTSKKEIIDRSKNFKEFNFPQSRVSKSPNSRISKAIEFYDQEGRSKAHGHHLCIV